MQKCIPVSYTHLGFKYHVELSTRPEDSMGSDEDWEMATDALRGALDDLQLPYVVNEGDGAFYGPKIDFHLEDSIGRTWQCGTIQLDFQLPLRFELEYTGDDGEKHRPIMIHRVVFGSICLLYTSFILLKSQLLFDGETACRVFLYKKGRTIFCILQR